MTAGHVGSAPACYNSSQGSNPDISQESVNEQFQKRVRRKLQKIQKEVTKDFYKSLMKKLT
jgi:hypothetical protein